MRELVEKYPFLLKDFRITDSAVLDKYVKPEHQRWCPLGWTPLQIASYRRNSYSLEFFLSLGFNPRTKKKRGGVSMEDNGVHISIKRGFLKGVEILLDVKKGRGISVSGPKCLVDEKNLLKKTPWMLAVLQYQRNNNRIGIELIKVVGRYRPSGYVEGYLNPNKEPLDGYEIAQRTHNQEINRLAKRYLVANNYGTYKGIKEEYKTRRTSPPDRLIK